MSSIKKGHYNYKGIPISEVCKNEGFVCINVLNNITYHSKREPNKSQTEIIESVINTYRKRKEFLKNKNILLKLELCQKNNLTKIAKDLHLNYSALLKIKKHGYNSLQAIKILFILSDRVDKNNALSISKKQLEKIQCLLQLNDPNKLDFYFAFCFSWLGYTDYYDVFCKYREKYLKNLVHIYLNKFHISSQNYDDIYQELIIKQLELFSKSYGNSLAQNLKYYNLCLKGFLIQHLKKLSQENNQIHLYDSKNGNQMYMDTISCN